MSQKKYKKTKLTPEDEQSKCSRDAVASLFRTIALETLPQAMRKIIYDDLRAMSIDDLQATIIDCQDNILASLLCEYQAYSDELQGLIGNILIYPGPPKQAFNATALENLTVTAEHFFFDRAENPEERTRRITFLAILHCYRCLEFILNNAKKNNYQTAAVEALLFALSAFQATHAHLVTEAIELNSSRKKKPEHFSHGQVLVNILAELLRKKGNFTAKEAGEIFYEEYPTGYSYKNVKIWYSPQEKALRYKKPTRESVWDLKSLQAYMTAARAILKN